MRFAALATALLVLALTGTSTDQGPDVALRVQQDGNKLSIGSFTGSLAAQFPPAGTVTVGNIE